MATELEKISVQELPSEIRDKLSSVQTELLIFSKQTFRIIDEPKVQTFEVGSSSKGNISTGGASVAISQNWSIFGGLSAISQTTINKFKTDIQLRLENTRTGEKEFISVSIPFELTLSLATGDTVDIFYAKGGLQELIKQDISYGEWTSFIGQNQETKQVIPLRPLPAFRMRNLTGFVVAMAIFGFLTLLGVANESSGVAYFSMFFALLFVASYIYNKLRQKKQLAIARSFIN